MKIEIETKYSIGDKVYSCCFGAVEENIIENIFIVHSAVPQKDIGYFPPWNEGNRVVYAFKGGGGTERESELFPSVEALKDSMFG